MHVRTSCSHLGHKGANMDLKGIGERMRAAREALGMTQEGAATAVGGSKRGIQNNEAHKSVPGGEVLAGFVSLGINANWLLTGMGEMRMPTGSATEFQAQEAGQNAYQAQPAKINVAALAAIIEGVAKAQPSASPARLAMLAAEFYEKTLSEGYITPDGVGDGPASKSA